MLLYTPLTRKQNKNKMLKKQNLKKKQCLLIACLAASGLTTYVCTAAVTQQRLENPCGLISHVLQKLLIIIIIIIITQTYPAKWFAFGDK